MKRVELITNIYKRRRLVIALRAVDATAVLLAAAALGVELLLRLIGGDFYTALYAAISLGVPFVLVSVLRRTLSLPRPYEVYDFGASIKHSGGSFPSRHAYSAFAIGSYLLFLNLPLGIAVLVLGALISASRVLLGLHFVRDVLAGAVIGVVAAIIGALIFLF